MPARSVWVEQLIDAGEQTELAKTPEATSLYADPDKAKTFVKDNVQQTVEILARQLAVRDALTPREKVADDRFMYLIQLKMAQLEAITVEKLTSVDAANAVERLQILNDTASALQLLVGTDTTLGIVTEKAGWGQTAWMVGGGAAGIAILIASGFFTGGVTWIAGAAAVAAAGGVGVMAGSQAGDLLEATAINESATDLVIAPGSGLQELKDIIENNAIEWNNDEYELGPNKGGAFIEIDTVSVMPESQFAKPKIELWRKVLEVTANPWVAYDMGLDPSNNRVKKAIEDWLRNSKSEITEQDVHTFSAVLDQIKSDIDQKYQEKMRDGASRLLGIRQGIAEFTSIWSDFDPRLTVDETNLLAKPAITMDDLVPLEALELKVRMAARDYLVTKLDPATTGFPNPSTAFTRAEALRGAITSLPNLTDPDVGQKLIRFAEKTKDIFDDYEQEKQIADLTTKLTAAQAELDTLRPENETLKREKEELQQEVDRLKGEITAQKGAIGALTAEIEELQRKIKELEGRNTPPAPPGEPGTREPDRPDAPREGRPKPPPAVREAREDEREAALHHIAREFFTTMEANFAEKRHVERKQYERKQDSLDGQSYSAVEKFVQIVRKAGDSPTGKEVRAGFKEAGLKKVGPFLEQNEAVHSFQYANTLVRALHDIREIGIPMKAVLKNDNGKGWDDINGSTGAVFDQVEIFLKPHFSHKED